MIRTSAGLLVYRSRSGVIEVLLVHPGGPFWAKRDDGAWSVPKGEHGPMDAPLEVAEREFNEELGVGPPPGEKIALGEIRQAGGKRVVVYAVEGDFDTDVAISNSFEMEWPPRSGNRASFPEIDRAEWFSLDAARSKLLAAQVPFLDRLAEALAPPES